MKIIWIMIVPLWLFSQNYGLKALIDHAQIANPMIKSTQLVSKAKAMEAEAAQSDFWPTLDIGASYSRVNPNSLVSPGEVRSGYATASVALYDGGRRAAILNAKRYAHTASLFEQEAFSKSITLKIIDGYYTVQKLQAMLTALHGQSRELQAQLERMRRFSAAGLATQEDIDRLVAAYENNRYIVENTKLMLETKLENLSLESGLEVRMVAKNTIAEPHKIAFEPYEHNKILKANADALDQSAKAVGAGYLPQVVLQDTYSRSEYDKIDPAAASMGVLLDHQNKAMLSVNMRLFDNGKMDKESEALKYQKMALESQREYVLREQKMQFRLAGKNLETIRAKLGSAQSALRAAQSSYRTVVKKFENGLADNIAYLDTLNNQTLAKAQYDETRYEYEVAKSIYYYYAGKDPREFIR